MIRWLEHAADLFLPRQNSIAFKIAADITAYGTGFPFLTAWVQQNAQGQKTALLCKKEQSWLLSATPNADGEELLFFLRAVGGETLQTERETAEALFCGVLEKRCFTELCFLKKEAVFAPAVHLERNNFSAAYDILFEDVNPAFLKTAYAGWYADLSHKARRNAAFCVNSAMAAAVVSHVYQKNAVISGVAVCAENRSRGKGRQILQGLFEKADERIARFYLCCAAETAPFYMKCGFSPMGQTAVLCLKNL